MQRRSSKSGNHVTVRGQAPCVPGISWVFALLLLVAGLGTACISVGPTLSREAGRSAGPFPDDYREVVRYWIDTELMDTSSVTDLQLTKPVPGVSKPVLFGKQTYGWFMRATFRPRDSLGISKGKSRYALLLRGNRVVASKKELY